MNKEKLKSPQTTARRAKVIVRFDQQQRKLLDFLRAERKFGAEDGEIIRNVVLQYLVQHQNEPQPKRRGKR
jgi:hypothetical protein